VIWVAKQATLEMAEETKNMTRPGCIAALMVLLLVAAGCSGGSPTSPRPYGESFEVTGVVTDDQGGPLGAAVVTMRYWLGGKIGVQSVLTDASGRYAIGFTSNPWMIGTSGRGAAQAEIFDLAYERYQRTVTATNSSLIENFRLHGIQFIAAGDSLVLSVAPDDGECPDDASGPCRIVRVAAPADGVMTVEALSTQPATEQPQVEVCCVSGNERYGNPLTMPVTAGTAYYEVQIGLSRGITTTQSVLLKTSLAPLEVPHSMPPSIPPRASSPNASAAARSARARFLSQALLLVASGVSALERQLGTTPAPSRPP
jgi:hypothetical protein